MSANMLHLFYLAAGIGLLAVGGEALIRGALAIAQRVGISPLLSGLLIVGFGTSMPELVVSVDAAISNRPDIAIGNIVGSNIGNLLLVLGLSAAITPLAVTPLALRRDALTVIGASVLFIVLAHDTALSGIDAAVLLAALLSYMLWAYRSERGDAAPAAAVHVAEAGEIARVPQSTVFAVGAVVVGLGVMIAGSQLLLAGAVAIAQGLGVSEAVIGLTLVAVGTSLPELTISVIAALRRHADVAVGNVLGSNIFNLLGILGVSALATPLDVAVRITAFDQWVMLGTALLLLLFLYSGRRLTRAEGAVLLLGYAAYLWASFLLVPA